MGPRNKIKSYDYLISNRIKVGQISPNVLEHLEYTKAYLIKKINVNCDAIHNLDS